MFFPILLKYSVSYFFDFTKFCIIEVSFKFSVNYFFVSEQFELKSYENTIRTSDRILHKKQLNISV